MRSIFNNSIINNTVFIDVMKTVLFPFKRTNFALKLSDVKISYHGENIQVHE